MGSLKFSDTSHYLPDNIVTNEDLSKFVDTNDEWIVKRTGISQRHFALSESNADMATKAARTILDRNNVKEEELSAIIVATFTGDNLTPSVACEVQKNLCLSSSVMCFDINAACSGFVFGLKIAYGLLLAEKDKKILLIASEKISDFLDFSDRNTCVLFGDGAGACLLEYQQSGDFNGIFSARGNTESIGCPNNGRGKEPKQSFVFMDGKEIFKFAVEVLPEMADKVLDYNGLNYDEIDWFVLHQANLRIITHFCKKKNIPMEKCFTNVQYTANTSAASIPIALSQMNEKGLLKKGNKILLAGFGAGLTWGSTVITW